MMRHSMVSGWTLARVAALAVALAANAAAQAPAPNADDASAAASPELCRVSSANAMAVDFKASTAQSQNRSTAEQLLLFDEALALWQKAAVHCEGRLKDRALRNVADTQQSRASLSEK